MNVEKPMPEPNSPRPREEAAGAQNERFLTLYNAAYPQIYAYVFSLLPDRNDALDAMQETSLVLLRRFDHFRFDPNGQTSEPEAFVRWGCGIALNQVRRWRREQAPAVQFSDEVLDRIAAARQQHARVLESRRKFLPGCLEKLSESDRDLALRCFCRSTSIKTVAEQMHRPANTLYKAANRIRAKLRECIDAAIRREEHS